MNMYRPHRLPIWTTPPEDYWLFKQFGGYCNIQRVLNFKSITGSCSFRCTEPMHLTSFYIYFGHISKYFRYSDVNNGETRCPRMIIKFHISTVLERSQCNNRVIHAHRLHYIRDGTCN